MQELKSTNTKRILDFDRKAVGFWMQTVDTDRPVRIFITYEALAAIDPSRVRDHAAALQIFDEHRAHVEEAASKKYKAGKIEDFTHEQQEVVLLRDHDVT
jgi:hypothetical protein